MTGKPHLTGCLPVRIGRGRRVIDELPTSRTRSNGDAYHPHYLTGKHKGFWNWTLHAVGLGMVREGSVSGARLEELVAGMAEADASPTTLVAHCRMHQLIATKPESKT